MKLLQVSTRDRLGGAEGSALNLHQAYIKRGIDSWLAVGRKHLPDPRILEIDRVGPGTSAYTRFLWRAARASKIRLVQRALEVAAFPQAWFDTLRGLEDFHYPGTRDTLRRLGHEPDLLHCHNLHGGYFDLRVLPEWSKRFPILLDLRDMWLLTGHCAHSFQCDRFAIGCGSCPDLTIPPAVRRDATAENWQRKRALFAASRLYVTSSSEWMAGLVRKSMLNPRMTRVIPNGIDLTIFRPRSRESARQKLGIAQNSHVIAFSARGARSNPFKDFQTLDATVQALGSIGGAEELVFLCLGDTGHGERIGRVLIRFIPFTNSPDEVSLHVNAADLYLHAARAETFGKSITEALACGVPVIATSVGGIPEQVKDLSASGPSEATGILVGLADVEGFIAASTRLLNDHQLRRRLGENAHRDATQRFGLDRQVRDFLEYYETIIEDWRTYL
ncbi:glycosyltransferase [bacterium CPR1]|nr:glycosyltransferase [bacterium CPR1]